MGELGVGGGVNKSPTALASKWIRHEGEGYGSEGVDWFSLSRKRKLGDDTEQSKLSHDVSEFEGR